MHATGSEGSHNITRRWKRISEVGQASNESLAHRPVRRVRDALSKSAMSPAPLTNVHHQYGHRVLAPVELHRYTVLLGLGRAARPSISQSAWNYSDVEASKARHPSIDA